MTFSGPFGPMIDNAPLVSQVADRVPVIGRPIAESTIGKERIADGPSCPAGKDAWVGDEQTLAPVRSRQVLSRDCNLLSPPASVDPGTARFAGNPLGSGT